MENLQAKREALPPTMKPAIIIPVYNHGRQIGAVINQTLKFGLPVFVVDDGSTDSTAQVIKEIKGITILRHSINQGKGAAILNGLGAAIAVNCNIAVTIDGDGQHNPEDIWSLFGAVRKNERSLVTGKRIGMDSAENVPWTSRFGRRFSNFWVWASGGPLLDDSQTGFRLYPIPETIELGVKARRYQFEVEVLVKAKQYGLKIKEAPVRVVYQEYGERVSHFHPWLDFWRNSTTFSRLIFARIFTIFRP